MLAIIFRAVAHVRQGLHSTLGVSGWTHQRQVCPHNLCKINHVLSLGHSPLWSRKTTFSGINVSYTSHGPVEGREESPSLTLFRNFRSRRKLNAELHLYHLFLNFQVTLKCAVNLDYATGGMKNGSMENSVSTFNRMMEHHTEILAELMSVTRSELFLNKFQQLSKPDSDEGNPHYRVRIEGVMAAYDGFIAFVEKVLRPKSGMWPAMIWGTAVFILKVIVRIPRLNIYPNHARQLSCETSHGREKSLSWLEKLSIMIALPRLGEHMYIDRREHRIAPETIQLFNDLFCSLGAIVKLLMNEPLMFGNFTLTIFLENDSLTF